MQQVYSQNNEQTVILNYFGDKIGTFLDLGANDGVTLSNTRALYLRGWFGCLVEPSRTAYKILEETYDDEDGYFLVHVAVGKQSDYITFYESGELLGSGDNSLVSTINPAELARWPKMKFTEYHQHVLPFSELLDMLPRKKFECISMDIEGSELDVLPQMDLRSLGCELLCVEWNGKNRAGFDAVVMHQGYKLLHTNAENLIYCVK